jgi:hypothetical protein
MIKARKLPEPAMHRRPDCAVRLPVLTAAVASCFACATLLPLPSAAADFALGELRASVSGRVTFGASYRLEDADPQLLNATNALAAGLVGSSASAANSDDSNLNFRRNDATSTVLKAYADLNLSQGPYSALVRVKAWHDYALLNQPRGWGNIPNGYTAGVPLGEQGFPSESRFAGVALADYYVQGRLQPAGMPLLARIGHQNLAWGERASFTSALQALNAVDSPAARRPGAAPQEARAPAPMAFARLELNPAFAIEGFYQTRLRSNVLDGCGTFGALNDYAIDGCEKVFAGAPAGSDRARLKGGAYVSRVGNPFADDGSQFGAALFFTAREIATEFGFYHARYTSRLITPGAVKTTRLTGSPLIAGDPDGKNVRYFIESPDGISLTAATFEHKFERGSVYGEFSYRPNLPVQLSASDVLAAFISNTAATQLRGDANALPPGGYFHAYDRLPVSQAQIGVTTQLGGEGGTTWSGMAEAVLKHTGALPDPTVRRYIRPDIFGGGPVNGVCVPSSANLAKQCSSNGYVSSNALAYRLRLDARMGALMPALVVTPSAMFTYDVKGWSFDGAINEKRQYMTIALRAEYRQRYLAEIVYTPNWGGDYNALSDRDLVSIAIGVKF